MKVKVISVKQHDFNGTAMAQYFCLMSDGGVGNFYSKPDSFKPDDDVLLDISLDSKSKFVVRPHINK